MYRSTSHVATVGSAEVTYPGRRRSLPQTSQYVLTQLQVDESRTLEKGLPF